ncbi:MAG: hypothetical protein ACE5J2_01440 [Nitrososphaerales archaeon]
MGRFAALSVFCIIGFAIGFLGYLAYPTVWSWLSNTLPNALPNLVPNPVFIGAIISGVAGAVASTFLVIRWSRRP